jgi:hypothetical protein
MLEKGFANASRRSQLAFWARQESIIPSAQSLAALDESAEGKRLHTSDTSN